MSAENLGELSTEELIRRFVETAKATPSVHTKDPGPGTWKQTPERVARVAQIHALGAELRARKPVADVRPLFEDENRDVCGWASGQLHSIDPEWASAAWSGLCYDHPTREVLDLTRRVRGRPPPRPTLKEMSDDQLIARFEDVATREYGARFIDSIGSKRDMAILNRILREAHMVGQEAKSRGVLERFAPLMDHHLITVRRQAASMCLGVAPERAEAVLEAVDNHHDPRERYRAWLVLSTWRDTHKRTRDWPRSPPG
jgi:hypothetical protein